MVARLVGCITTAAVVSLLAQQVPPTIRSRTTMVPVDVRVVDLKGNPVTGLEQEDFTIKEDGVRQDIRLFDAHALTPEPPRPGRPPLRKAQSADAPLTAPNQRIFLFVFGRGRLQWPDRGIDSSIRFVRDRLLPQDRVAVLAYNRATDVTTDRASIVTTLERFRKSHDAIEALMQQQFGGLQAIFAAKAPPNKDIQKEIDAVFGGPGTVNARRLPPGTPTDAALIAADTRRTADALLRAEMIAQRPPGPFDAFDRSATEAMEVTFEEYARQHVQTFQDLGNIYAGINYLKYLDGEKHLVFVSEGGLFLPRLENDHSIAALASDARVVIDVLQTGGIILSGPGSPGVPPATGSPPRDGSNMARAGLGAGQTSRNLADFTGGMAAVYTSSEKTLAKIDASSRFHYLLGYVPVNGAWDGRFRRIGVTVNRKDVRVLYRHGYYAREEYVPFDRRQFMTYSRVASAGNMTEPLTDLKVVATAEYAKGAMGILVTVTLAADRVAFEHANGKHTASLEVVYFAGTAKQALVGEHWQAVDLNLTDASYEQFRTRGVSYTQPIAVTGEPRFVKVIVYDYAADLTGTALVMIPAPK